jgi:hypothetical protein
MWWNKIKNRLIVRLMKNTRLHARTCYAFVNKVERNELLTYMRAYTFDPHTEEEKFKMIFGGK